SLRAALNLANLNGPSSDNTITFQTGLSGTITLASALPALTANVTINGPGANLLAVSGNNIYMNGVFYVNSGVTASLANLTITNGKAGNGGGGIENFGTLTVSGCTLSGNHADNSTFGGGGGIENFGTLTVNGCTLFGNHADSSRGGGGIFNQGGT